MVEILYNDGPVVVASNNVLKGSTYYYSMCI